MAGQPDIRTTDGVRRTIHLDLAADELAPAQADVVGADLLGALDTIAGSGPVDLYLRPGAIELSTSLAGGAVWETVLVSARLARRQEDGVRRTTVGRDALRTALTGAGAETLRVRIAPNGAMTIGEVVLTPAPDDSAQPPRPDASGVLSERLSLPSSASGIEMILRLDGPNVCVPENVRTEFGRRLVSSVSLFERHGDWFISGVRNGTPTLIVVGAVGVY